MLPYGRQSINEDDISAVLAALQSDFLTQGPAIGKFEREFADRVGAAHAVAVNSATAALHLAMRVAGVRPGDRVVTSPITFLASANAAAYVGATPDFCDVDPLSYTIDPRQLEASWQSDTRAVVAVDYAGQACEMPAIARVARSRGAVVIEDACHAAGGKFHDDVAGGPWHTGCNPWSDIGIFSFHPVKTITTGEGGMLVTNRADWAEHARVLRSHGMIRESRQFIAPGGDDPLAEKGPWYYEMQDLGYNYRLTELQAALGISQLRRLDDFVTRRRAIVAAYNEGLGGILGLTTPRLRNRQDISTTSWHLYTVQIDFKLIGKPRSEVMTQLRNLGVATQVLYIPVHLQPWYRQQYGYAPGKCEVAEAFYARALSLPIYPALSDGDVQLVIDAVKKVLLR
jgi:perosamine synthetase